MWMQIYVHLALIDHENAFDWMENVGIADKGLWLLNDICKEEIAANSVNGNRSNWSQLNLGVRQRSVLSPDVFPLYAENITRTILTAEGFKVNALPINNIRHADDTLLMADSTQRLQRLLSSK